MGSIRQRAAAMTIALLASAPMAAHAQRADDRIWVQMGAFFPKIDSDVRIDQNELSLGTEIDLESDLGLNDNATVFNGVLGYQFARRWHVEVEYFAIGRKSTAAIDREIVIDDSVFPASAEVSGRLDSDVYRLSVGWSAIANEKTRVNLSLGFHVTDFLLRFEGQAAVGDDIFESAVESRSLLAPLPTIGVYATHSFNERISVSARGDFFSLKIDEYDGTLWNARIGASYRFHKKLGIGAGWRLTSYDVGIDGAGDLTGRIKYKFNGPFVVLEAGF